MSSFFPTETIQAVFLLKIAPSATCNTDITHSSLLSNASLSTLDQFTVLSEKKAPTLSLSQWSNGQSGRSTPGAKYNSLCQTPTIPLHLSISVVARVTAKYWQEGESRELSGWFGTLSFLPCRKSNPTYRVLGRCLSNLVESR